MSSALSTWGRVVIPHANDRRYARALRHAAEVLCGLDVQGAVFGIQDDEVEAGVRGDFDERAGCEVDERAEDDLTGCQFGLQAGFGHYASPQCGPNQWIRCVRLI